MSTVTEVKEATEKLSSKDRWELFIWLRDSEELRTRQLEELRRDLGVGVRQADQGEVAPLDIPSIRVKIHQRLKETAQS